MKKFAMAAVAAAAMTAGVAQAYTMGTFSNGVVVPNVIHNGAADTTAVGLINRSGTIKSRVWVWKVAVVIWCLLWVVCLTQFLLLLARRLKLHCQMQ